MSTHFMKQPMGVLTNSVHVSFISYLLAPLLKSPTRVHPPILSSQATRGEPESPGHTDPPNPPWTRLVDPPSADTAHSFPKLSWSRQPAVQEEGITCNKLYLQFVVAAQSFS